MTINTEFYKIRNKETGLFSGGTSGVSFTDNWKWSKCGKTWARKNHVNCHLGLFTDWRTKEPYFPDTWEVIHFKIENDNLTMTIHNAKDFYESRRRK